jgi:ribose transport system ATP-binding protein
MSAPPILSARGVSRTFGPVPVLRGINLDLRPGSVHAVLGENGAGKSTLMKILAGQIEPSAGTLHVDGRPVAFAGVRDAESHGIALIHQELNLAPHLSVAANIFLGRELRRGPFLQEAAMQARASAVLAELGCPLDPAAPVRSLTVAQRQMVEIAKAVSRDVRVLIMDEPTAVLTGTEAAVLARFIRKLADGGAAIAYISHKLDEALALADEVTVLRDGALVATRPAAGLTANAVARLMVGRDVSDLFPPKAPPGRNPPVALSVRGVSVPGRVQDASFELRQGEILGFAGLVGAGRTELMEAVAGLRPRNAGTICRDGAPVRIRTLRDATAAGIAYLTEDRKGRGLLVGQPPRPNLTLLALRRYGRVLVDERQEDAALAQAVRAFDIRAARLDGPVAHLSGGNQQKLLFAKVLQVAPRVLIVDEPTRGVDVGTKQQIYRLLHGLAAEGVAIVLVSSEMAEVTGLSHRVCVMRHGRIAGVLAGDAVTADAVLDLAAGVPSAAAA